MCLALRSMLGSKRFKNSFKSMVKSLNLTTSKVEINKVENNNKEVHVNNKDLHSLTALLSLLSLTMLKLL